ncbi:glycosyltransferase [Paracoccus sp. SCSIO 75233]|uniref:glycosyltransferase n=1 Tax=Paracoccus sp. SCSIO 75233 TaxID=3017782 RepID=UPI0022F0E248|nr:glycosyltransferase [Paracoccus sp. SCSIO 75233]WBU54339.1 glycosyltransferase [Paracoccus sp. SCSIO 75233]
MRLLSGWKLPPRQPNPGLAPQRRRLLYCLHQSLPHVTNGYANRSHGIAVGLEKNGWSVRATTRCGFPWDIKGKGISERFHEAKVAGITYAAQAGYDLNKTPLDYYLAETADHFLREAQLSGAEMIVAASNHITALPALMAARRLGLPFIYELRGLWELTRASTQPDWMNSERYELARTLEKQVALEADGVITLTQELVDELVSWGVPRDLISLVPNAVDTERFTATPADMTTAAELGLADGVPVIGYAGSAVAYEGLDLLMRALAQLHEQGRDFVFVLVGDGASTDGLQEAAKELGIAKKCRFVGRVPFDQVPRYLSCMDIMPIPRLSLPVTEMVSALKPLEAMAMGKALVLSDVSPHKVMSGDGKRARTFAAGDAADLARVLGELMDDRAERDRLGREARAWTEDERSWNRVTKTYSDALDAVRDRTIRSETTKGAAKPVEEITLGLIADRFTTDSIAGAVNILPLSPDDWRQELDRNSIDALLVESAWAGNDGKWHRKVGHYGEDAFAALKALLEHCREAGIPTLFWNKEDPVHFDRFRRTASLCDHVFTTDSRRIIPYLSTPNAVTKTASSISFFASPRLHNLLPSKRQWQETAAYGGTYYGERYADRTEYIDKIASAASPIGLTIYDRQHNNPESPYKYPAGLAGHVAGGLDYADMVEAYKAHPVQLNVNSVMDSPTMFSRRVIEAAACGTPQISGPAQGMSRYLDGNIEVIASESDTAAALERLMDHPAHRWRIGLAAARAVMRAHTVQHRLTQMLRTAGLRIAAPQPPAVGLITDKITMKIAEILRNQSIRPQIIVATDWESETKAYLEQGLIECIEPYERTTSAGESWIVTDAATLLTCEADDFEDLIWLSSYAPHQRIGFRHDTEPRGEDWPGPSFETSEFDPAPELLRPPAGLALTPDALKGWASTQNGLGLRKPDAVYQQKPVLQQRETLLIAGHDLKFVRRFFPFFRDAGYRVLLDFWDGHNKHNPNSSRRLIEQADVVFCEWMLGNAVWYGNHKLPGQRLIGRLHRQEIVSPLLPKVPLQAFDSVMFVGPHILRDVSARFPVLHQNGHVVYNGVDVAGLQSVPRRTSNGKVLGFVGMVPQSKRIDIALDILRELRRSDDSYTLRIKGKQPADFAWMSNRPEEMAWFAHQYSRLENDPLLKGAVAFDPQGDDMAEWYAGVDFVLSTSDFESFHYSIADGAAAGCRPICLPWDGADEIYPTAWVYADVTDAVEGIRNWRGDLGEVRAFAERNFDLPHIASAIIDQLAPHRIEGDDSQRNVIGI